jgi:hypothetical protein
LLLPTLPLLRGSLWPPLAARLRYQNHGTLHSSITITINHACTPSLTHSHRLSPVTTHIGGQDGYHSTMGSTLNAVHLSTACGCLLAGLLRTGSLPRRSFLWSLVASSPRPSSSANLSQPPASASHVTHNHAPGVANSFSHRTNQVHTMPLLGYKQPPPPFLPALHPISS